MDSVWASNLPFKLVVEVLEPAPRDRTRSSGPGWIVSRSYYTVTNPRLSSMPS
jgi:hypothetical protein